MSDRRGRAKQASPQRSEITRLTQELAELIRLDTEIDEKNATRRDEDVPPAEQDLLPDGRHRAIFFEHVNIEINDAVDTLKAGIALRQAESLADVATLVVIYFSTVSEIVDNDLDEESYCYKVLVRRLRRLDHAITRGFIKFGPDNPLLKVSYFVNAPCPTFADDLATARKAVARMPLAGQALAKAVAKYAAGEEGNG